MGLANNLGIPRASFANPSFVRFDVSTGAQGSTNGTTVTYTYKQEKGSDLAGVHNSVLGDYIEIIREGVYSITHGSGSTTAEAFAVALNAQTFGNNGPSSLNRYGTNDRINEVLLYGVNVANVVGSI